MFKLWNNLSQLFFFRAVCGKVAALFLALGLPVVAGGCFDTAGKPPEAVLLRVGERVVTRGDFERALEAAESAYPRSTLRDPGVAAEIRRGVLNELVESSILSAAAEAEKIRVSDEEVEAEVGRLKADFPEGAFEAVFLENAVSYETWRTQLRLRLLAEKVARTLVDGAEGGPEGAAPGEAAERRDKMEKAYAAWLKGHRKRTAVELNREQWEQIVGSPLASTNAPNPPADPRPGAGER